MGSEPVQWTHGTLLHEYQKVLAKLNEVSGELERLQDTIDSKQGVINAVDRALLASGHIHASRAIAVENLMKQRDEIIAANQQLGSRHAFDTIAIESLKAHRDDLAKQLSTAGDEAARLVNATLAELEKVRAENLTLSGIIAAALHGVADPRMLTIGEAQVLGRKLIDENEAMRQELAALKAAQPRMVKLPRRYEYGGITAYDREWMRAADVIAALTAAGINHE